MAHRLAREQPYLRGLLDMLGVQPEFLTCGAYKSAAELFMRKGPSKEADEMTNWLLDGIFDTTVNLIARGRKVEVSKVKELDRRRPVLRPKRPRRPG